MALAKQPPNALPGPPEDGLRAPDGGGTRREVVRRFGAFIDVDHRLTTRARRACIILAEDYGCERDEAADHLYWSPALLAAQTRTPFERIIVCTNSTQAALTVVERVARGVPEVDAHAPSLTDGVALERIRRATTPTLVALAGWNAETIAVAKSLLPGFRPQRSLTMLVDGALSLELVAMLALHERVDVIATAAVGALSSVSRYLTREVGLNAPKANLLTPFVASSTAFASSTAERAELWARLRSDGGHASDEFFFTAG